jgi:antitoxin (DNA-binding transcriptional repressor) of toxin-antitoxin stability system
MDRIVTIHVAMTTLSQLIAPVEAGEEIIIARDKQPVAKLAPIQRAEPKRRFGVMRGKARVDAAFFEPLPEDESKAWE